MTDTASRPIINTASHLGRSIELASPSSMMSGLDGETLFGVSIPIPNRETKERFAREDGVVAAVTVSRSEDGYDEYDENDAGEDNTVHLLSPGGDASTFDDFEQILNDAYREVTEHVDVETHLESQPETHINKSLSVVQRNVKRFSVAQPKKTVVDEPALLSVSEKTRLFTDKMISGPQKTAAVGVMRSNIGNNFKENNRPPHFKSTPSAGQKGPRTKFGLPPAHSRFAHDKENSLPRLAPHNGTTKPQTNIKHMKPKPVPLPRRTRSSPQKISSQRLENAAHHNRLPPTHNQAAPARELPPKFLIRSMNKLSPRTSRQLPMDSPATRTDFMAGLSPEKRKNAKMYGVPSYAGRLGKDGFGGNRPKKIVRTWTGGSEIVSPTHILRMHNGRVFSFEKKDGRYVKTAAAMAASPDVSLYREPEEDLEEHSSIHKLNFTDQDGLSHSFYKDDDDNISVVVYEKLPGGVLAKEPFNATDNNTKEEEEEERDECTHLLCGVNMYADDGTMMDEQSIMDYSMISHYTVASELDDFDMALKNSAGSVYGYSVATPIQPPSLDDVFTGYSKSNQLTPRSAMEHISRLKGNSEKPFYNVSAKPNSQDSVTIGCVSSEMEEETPTIPEDIRNLSSPVSKAKSKQKKYKKTQKPNKKGNAPPLPHVVDTPCGCFSFLR